MCAAVHMHLCLLNWLCERAWATHRCKRAKGMAERDSWFGYNRILRLLLPPLCDVIWGSQTSWHIAFLYSFQEFSFLFFLRFYHTYLFLIPFYSVSPLAVFCLLMKICFFLSPLIPSSGVFFFSVFPQAFLVSTIPLPSSLSRPRCLRHKWFRLVIRQTKS